MRKGKKQRGDIMEQIKRRFADGSGTPMSVTIERSITAYKKDGRTSHNRQRTADHAVGVEIVSSYAMKMEMGKLSDRSKQEKSEMEDINLCTSDEESTDDEYSYRRARYQQEPGEECRGCHCCCCPCKKRLLQMDEYKILLCGVSTGIQALVDRARRNEEQSAESETLSKSLKSRRAKYMAALHEGPICSKRRAADCLRRIEDHIDREEVDCYMIAKPVGPLWKLEWKTKDDLLKQMKVMGLVRFSYFVRNWCSYMSQHVTGPAKFTPEEYNAMSELGSDCEDIPFNSWKFDKLHQVVSLYNSKWISSLMCAQEDDDYFAVRRRNDMLMSHYRILDKFDFDKGLHEYDATMRTYRLTHACGNRARVPDIECRICRKPLKGSCDVVILLDALQYLHFNCLYEIMKTPVYPCAPPGLLRHRCNK